MTGRIALRCAVRSGRSTLVQLRAEGLSRISRPRRTGPAAHVVLAQLGPGILGGDTYALDVDVAAGAQLVVTAQMATPVYARAHASSLRATIRVGADGSFVGHGEPVMLDAGARHDAFATLDLAAGARAVLADIVTVGPGACVRLRTTVAIDGRLVARDACDLRERAGAIATLVVAGGDAAERAALLAALEPLLDAQPAVRGGIGATRDVLFVRATSPRVWELQCWIDDLISVALGRRHGGFRSKVV